MKPKQADRYCGQLVAVTFKRDWINEAFQIWIIEEEEYTGILKHCQCEGQEGYYQLESDGFLPTDCACWSANMMKRIRVII